MLESNPGSWNKRAGLLIVDQPVGTGFSVAGEKHFASYPPPKMSQKLLTAAFSNAQDFYAPSTFCHLLDGREKPLQLSVEMERIAMLSSAFLRLRMIIFGKHLFR